MNIGFLGAGTRDVVAQLASAKVPDVDLVLSTAGSAANIRWIASVLRPFGHLSVVDMAASLDVSPLGMKSASLHTEMVLSRVLHGSDVGRQGQILETVAAFIVEGRLRPIATTRLEELTVETMQAAHALVESRRTIGKVVITR